MPAQIVALHLHPSLKSLLRAHQLEAADGRPLYAYDLRPDWVDLVRGQLCTRAKAQGWNALTDGSGSAAALFALVACHAIRRDERAGGWEWGPLCDLIGLRYDDANRQRQLLDPLRRGLRLMRRPVRTGSGGHTEYLKTLYAEAGIPVGVGPWLQAWLTRAVRAVEGGLDTEEAARRAAAGVNLTNAEWFVPAAGELAGRLVGYLRRIPSPDLRGGTDATTWLDETEPGWVDTLCRGVGLGPANAQTLLKRLVGELAGQPVRGTIAARRLLRLGPDGWQAEVALDLDGPAPRAWDPALRPFEDRTQARLLAAGRLGERVQTSLARLVRERNDDGTERWQVRGTGAKPWPLALADAATAVLVSDGLASDPVTLAPPVETGSPVLTLVAIDPHGEVGQGLELIAGGSCRVRAPTAILALAVDVPVPADATDLGLRWAGRRLVRIDRETTVGDIVVRVGVTEPAWVLRPQGPTVPRVRGQVLQRVESVYREAEGVTSRLPPDQCRWRPLGERQWRRWGTGPEGDCAIGMAQPDGTIEGDLPVRVLPPHLSIEVRRDGVHVTGLRPVDQVTTEGSHRVETIRDGVVIRPGGAVVRSIPVQLWLPGRVRPFVLDVADPRAWACLTDPEGRGVGPDRTLSLDALGGWTLVVDRSSPVLLEQIGGTGEMPTLERTIERTRPLISLAPDLRALLADARSQDARVRLSWVGGDRIVEIGHHSWNWGERAPPGAKLTVLALPLLAPVAPITAYEGGMLPAKTVALPEGASGPWLLLPTRDGQRGRPAAVQGPEPVPNADDPLIQAQLHKRQEARLRALRDLLDDPAQRPRVLDLIGQLLDSVGGLASPWALDPLVVLSGHPAAPVWLLSRTKTIGLAARLELELDLPILWVGTRLADWRAAFEARRADLTAHLTEPFGPEEAAAEAESRVRGQLQAIVRARPALRAHAAWAAGDRLSDDVLRGAEEASRPEARRALLHLELHAAVPAPDPSLDLPPGFAAPDVARVAGEGWVAHAAAPLLLARSAADPTAKRPPDAWLWRARAAAPDWFDRAVEQELLCHIDRLMRGSAR